GREMRRGGLGSNATEGNRLSGACEGAGRTSSRKLLLLGCCWCRCCFGSGLQVGSGLLQVCDRLGIQFVLRRLIFSLRDIFLAVLGNEHFLDSLVVLGRDSHIERRR